MTDYIVNRLFRWAAVEEADGPASPELGHCQHCKGTIWQKESRFVDADGIMYHAICFITRRAETAERKLATLTEKLRALSAEWKRRANEERNEWYNDSQSIDRFTEELDEILETT
jgi:uncharacterized protein YukE